MLKARSMKLKDAYEAYKKFKVPSLSKIRDTASEHSKTSLVIIILLFVLLLLALQYIPHYQVAQFNITNQKDLADAENSYRATLAQIFGGVAIAIGLYYTWRRIGIAEEDLKTTQKTLEVAQEGQITERFTRAIEQLGAVDTAGNPAIEIRLGGIYALERIANESDKDYWPIMEILTAYIRENSPSIGIKNEDIHGVLKQEKISLDIQAILTVIRRRKNSFNDGESNSLDLSSSYLGWTDLRKVNLADANLQGANLYGSGLQGANFEKAILEEVIFKDANLKGTNFQEAKLSLSEFEKASLIEAIFIKADLTGADFIEADLQRANFEKAILGGASLKGAKNLTIDQLSKANTLYQAQLDPELEKELRAKGFGHLIDNEPKD
jgi:uncharacterized protein YjbI with pentapeptide repeats